METRKTFNTICAAIVVCSLLITVLFMNGESFGITKIVDEDAEQNSDSNYFTSADQNGNWDTSGATVITLTGDGAEISGNGAYTSEGNVVITNGGCYVVSGTLTDGYLSVDAYDSSKVWILLDGVGITCSDDACIRVDQADKVFLTLSENSQNILSSGSSYSDQALSDGTDGAIYAHDDLTINGSGSLTINAEYRHGIAANDDLVITGGTITVTAAADAIHANDSIRIKEAAITAEAGDDGIVTSNEVENGYLYIESGTLDITSSDDAIHTTGDVTICGGQITINTGDDGIHSDNSVYISDGALEIGECYEGIEALIIDVSGGDITIYCKDDGFNANGGSGDMFGGQGGGHMGGGQGSGHMGGGQSGGHRGDSQEMSGQDSTGQSTTGQSTTDQSTTDQEIGPMDGAGGEMPAPPDMAETDGEMPAPPDMGNKDGERPARPDMAETDGEMSDSSETNGEMPASPNVGASDEASIPSQKTGTSDGTSQQSEEAESEETYISISGGTITIINETGSDADGLDSNGDIRISGGNIYISLLGTGSNNAVDYGSESGGVAEITGGTIIACGASSMAEAFDTTSTQASILYNFSPAAEAGTVLSIKDSDGNVLASWKVPCSFTSALISCPQMQVGESYQVVIGETSEEITVEEVSSTYGDAQSSMPGGDMNGGGRHSRGGSKEDATGDGAADSTADSGDGAAADNTQGTPPQKPEDMQGGTGDGATQAVSQESSQDQPSDGSSGYPQDQSSGRPQGQSTDGSSGQSQGQSSGRPQDQPSDGSSGQSQDQPSGRPQDQSTDGSSGQSQDQPSGRPQDQISDGSEQELSQNEEDQAAEQTVTAQPVDHQTWAIIGGCTFVLIAAIVIGKIYKRH